MPTLKDFFEGSRKFTVMVAVLVVGVVFRIMGYVNGAELVSLFNGVGIAFMGSNAVEHVVSAVKDWAVGKVEEKE